MSAVEKVEFERRIVHGIPVNVVKGTAKTGIIDLYTWNSDRSIKIGKYDYSANRITIDDSVVTALEPELEAWRTSQVPRSRAEIRTGH
jgi:type IV secretory pathway protease TraF